MSPLARCIRDERTVAVEKEVIGRSGGGRSAKMGRVTVRSVLLDALACVSSGEGDRSARNDSRSCRPQDDLPWGAP